MWTQKKEIRVKGAELYPANQTICFSKLIRTIDNMNPEQCSGTGPVTGWISTG